MKEYTVYPGEYIPLPEVNAVVQELKSARKTAVAHPLVNIDEYEHFFKIEVVIYGVSRDEILITADENILSVTGINKDKEEHATHQLHEFDHCCFTRYIILPPNTDPEYIVAEYRSGILSVYVPKSSVPLKNVHTTIAVY